MSIGVYILGTVHAEQETDQLVTHLAPSVISRRIVLWTDRDGTLQELGPYKPRVVVFLANQGNLILHGACVNRLRSPKYRVLFVPASTKEWTVVAERILHIADEEERLKLKPVRDISPEEENFRMVASGRIRAIRRDPIEPVPVGSFVVEVYRVTGYDEDCDGSLTARLENVDRHGAPTGLVRRHASLRPDSTLQVDHPSELWEAENDRSV